MKSICEGIYCWYRISFEKIVLFNDYFLNPECETEECLDKIVVSDDDYCDYNTDDDDDEEEDDMDDEDSGDSGNGKA